MSSSTPLSVAPMHSLGALRITGADARTFLQGQLSNDLNRLSPERALLASCNSSRGRVQSILTLLQRESDIFAVLPTAMLKKTLTRLRSFVLRSKVVLEEAAPGTSEWLIAPLCGAQATAATPHLPLEPGQTVHENGLTVLRWWSADERYLLLAPRAALTVTDAAPQDAAWRQADIAAGVPQVYPETHEAFVAQMVNLDLLKGISFDKGCYTGQEIIARTHYRGTVKRRMLRFAAACAAPAPGTPVVEGTEHAGDVVDAVATPTGCELLAVVSLDDRAKALCLKEIPGSALTRLSLPYGLPEERPAPLEQAS